MISRHYLFLVFVLLGFFNPVSLFLLPYTSLTWFFVVPCTLMVWFLVKWKEIVAISEVSSNYEILLGCTIYFLNIVRNALSFPGTRGFGLFDMLVAFISVCIAFYGLKALRHFVLPTAYLSIMIIGYQLEFAITEVAFLENFLANLMVSLLNILTIGASANGNMVTVYSRGGPFQLVIDAPCTGIKGMLAYGSLAVLMILDVKATYRRKALCAIVGLVGTFFMNILRLLIIFVACYFFGIETAYEVHTYLGYSIFIVWVIVFWTVAFKYLLPSKKESPSM